MPLVLVRRMMSLYGGAVAAVRVDFELSEEFEVKVGILQGFVLSLSYAVVVDAVTELAMEGVVSELLCADDLVLVSELCADDLVLVSELCADDLVSELCADDLVMVSETSAEGGRSCAWKSVRFSG